MFGPVPDGIEVSRRVAGDKTAFVVINFSPEKQSVSLPRSMRSLLDQREVTHLELPQYGVAVLREEKKP